MKELLVRMQHWLDLTRKVDWLGPLALRLYLVPVFWVAGMNKASGFGNVVEIDHQNGYVTLYAHNSAFLVKEGDVVRAGQIVAKAGSTGRSTGPHVHFEVHKDGRPVNPRPFLEKAPHVLKEARTAGPRQQAGA